jgi:adenosylcobyric acid synthase
MAGKVLMIQGASSSVGKSLLVTALCRLFAQRGVRVAPFKAQNMSNNAAVCVDGAEIGRAQAVQAAAAGVEPTAEMNPILLKPEGHARSQVIVMGRAWRTLRAGEYYQHKAELWPVVTTALDRLRAAYELVVIEGAGSPAELNLQATDMVNMAVARYAHSPVLLVGDIDRGGVFAQLLGTLWLLPAAEQALVRALVVNKFRGDLSLFAEGVRILEARSALPVLGVVPFIPDLYIPEEDSASLAEVAEIPPVGGDEIDIAIIRLPRLANFDDFSPLAAEGGIRLRYVHSCTTLGRPHAVILPGTKSTIADLVWLQEQGLAQAIRALAATGTAVAGICGGYQMLGRNILDPQGVESPRSHISGLGLLPVDTVFEPVKATHQAEARILGGPDWLATLQGQTIQGYEIHMGRTTSQQPWLTITRHSTPPTSLLDGATDATGRVWGCYLHGLFANTALRRAWLTSLGWRAAVQPVGAAMSLQVALDTLASQVGASLDMQRLQDIVWAD